MASSGEEKEMRMPGSLNLEHSQNHRDPIQAQQEQLIQQEKIRPAGGGGGGGATKALNSGGSKRKSSSSPFGRNNVNVRYRECRKNYAASTGGYITDGCGEFMPSGEDGSLEAFKCAACQCHRNFHRKEVNGENSGAIVVHQLQLPPPLPSPFVNHRGSVEHHWPTIVQPLKMAFGSSGGGTGGGSTIAATDSSSDHELNLNAHQSNSIPPPSQHQFVLTRKRFRTKFSRDQKEKMHAFADKLGWMLPRKDDSEVQRFCAENGVKRQVFKIWMHNNKKSAKKTPQDQS